MNSYTRQLETLAAAVDVDSPTTFYWFGERSPRLHPHVRRGLTAVAARGYLRHMLSHQLYNDFYCKGGAVPASGGARPRLQSNVPFLMRLAEANLTVRSLESGWTLAQVRGRELIVDRGRLSLRIREDSCLAGDGIPTAPGEELQIRSPGALSALSPGYYMALGEIELRGDVPGGLVRLYWNVDAEGAVLLMRIATRALNEAGIPYRLKVVNNPESYARADAAVLYIHKVEYGKARRHLESLYAAVSRARRVREAVPALTKPLAPGLGLAEGPPSGGSFGLHRCELLADGLIGAYEEDRHSSSERLKSMVARLAGSLIDHEQPFLETGSDDVYQFRPRTATRRGHARGAAAGRPLEAAAGIGRYLVATALWHEERCTWIGAIPQQNAHAATYRTLGADLYWGTSGVGLFLSELYSQIGHSELRQTAQGALQHALNQSSSIAAGDRIGLYSGWPGTALAAVRAGMLLGDGGLAAAGLNLLVRLRDEALSDGAAYGHDMVAGRAGAIAALLLIHEATADGSLLEWAARLGDELIRAADSSNTGSSWRTTAGAASHNLTGLGHGAAGIASALLELSRVSGEGKYRSAAEMGFCYERQWFDRMEGNWADLRVGAPARRHSRARHRYLSYWCHGSAGIALTRALAYVETGLEEYREEALAGTASTRRSVQSALSSGPADFSLCHGLAGQAEALHICAQLVPDGDGAKESAHIVEAVAEAGLRHFGGDPPAWPCGCGINGGMTQGLMIGLSGIGLFLLRLHDPSIPSLLLPFGRLGSIVRNTHW